MRIVTTNGSVAELGDNGIEVVKLIFDLVDPDVQNASLCEELIVTCLRFTSCATEQRAERRGVVEATSARRSILRPIATASSWQWRLLLLQRLIAFEATLPGQSRIPTRSDESLLFFRQGHAWACKLHMRMM